MKNFIDSIILFLLLVNITGCATTSLADYRKTYPPEAFESSKPYDVLFQDLSDRMKRCYPQDSTIVDQETNNFLDQGQKVGTIYYGVEGALGGTNILYLLDVMPKGSGSTVRMYAKGDLFRTTSELRENLSKWVRGEKGHCKGAGEI